MNILATCLICDQQVNVCCQKNVKDFKKLCTSCNRKYSFYSSSEINIDKRGKKTTT